MPAPSLFLVAVVVAVLAVAAAALAGVPAQPGPRFPEVVVASSCTGGVSTTITGSGAVARTIAHARGAALEKITEEMKKEDKNNNGVPDVLEKCRANLKEKRDAVDAQCKAVKDACRVDLCFYTRYLPVEADCDGSAYAVNVFPLNEKDDVIVLSTSSGPETHSCSCDVRTQPYNPEGPQLPEPRKLTGS